MPVPIVPIEVQDAPPLAVPYLSGPTPSALAALLAHVPELVAPTFGFMDAIYGPSSLPDRLKELVVVRLSALNGCTYCTRTHDVFAREAGVSASEIAALIAEAPVDGVTFAPRERAALAFAERLARDDAAARLAASGTARAYFREDEVVALAMLACATLCLNRFCTALGVV